MVTGASSGLGEQIAYAAAKKGSHLVLCARRLEVLEQVKAKVQTLSENEAVVYPLDLSDPEAVEEVLANIQAEVGSIDVLVNCAGFGLFENFLDFSMEQAEKMFRVNVLGLMYVTQKVALMMAENGTGHIINVASQAGKMATPKSSVYSATKFAVLGFSNALRLELKPLGIYVTTVNPGPIATNFFNIADQSGEYLKAVQGTILQPEQLAGRIVQIMGTNKREINAPWYMEVASRVYPLFPHVGDFLASTLFNRK